MFPVLCDLDGVVWLLQEPIPGSVEAIGHLRAAGHRVLFVTNNSSAIVEEQEAALGRIGIPADGDVLTSAQAAATLLDRGERVLVLGGDGIRQAVQAVGATLVDPAEVDDCDSIDDSGRGAQIDAVVVGWHRDFDYDGMRRASTAVLRGARLIGTNDDATYPTPDGPIPGGGAILAAVATAAERRPEIAGKPHAPMAELVRRTIGDTAALSAVMVGDRPSTDGQFAVTLGCRYAHVDSGVTPSGVSVEPRPFWRGADLAEIAAQLLVTRR